MEWHRLSPADVARHLEVAPEQGFLETEVAARLEKYGPNSLSTRMGANVLLLFLGQFNQPLIFNLLAAGGGGEGSALEDGEGVMASVHL